MDPAKLQRITTLLASLSPTKFALIERAIEGFTRPIKTTIAPDSAPFDQCFVDAFSDALQTHHAMSNQPFTKDKFEYALIGAFEACKIPAEDSGSKTRQGYDVLVDGVKWSLKTQADRNIKPDRIWISKYMEMGRGQWITVDDLPGLRDRFLHHMEDYERIFTLRHWEQNVNGPHHFYELVEIPKALLQESKNGKFKMMDDSRQNPKPGYCTVDDGMGGCKFELYFDGGSEKKLQLKNLLKKYCKVIATWLFPLS